MIELFIAAIIVYGVLASLAFFYAKRRKVLLWVAITASGYGHQSLSHVIEVPIALIISLAILNLRIFVIDKYTKNYKMNSYMALSLTLIFVFLLRTFMPYLPE